MSREIHDDELKALRAEVTVLRRELARFRAIYELGPVPAQFYDARGVSLGLNEPMRAFLGLPSREVGVGSFNVLEDPFMESTGTAEVFRKVYQTRRAVDIAGVEADLGAAHARWGTEVRKAVYDNKILPILDGEELIGVVSMVCERTAEVVAARANAELERANTELAQSNEELRRFAYVVSHDLQEPVRTVATMTRLLAEEASPKLSPESQEYTGFIVKAADRMQRLIRDLHAYARVGSKSLTLESVDLARLIEDVRLALTQAIEDSGAELVVGPMPSVWGDATQLSQLLQNLVQNAIKFRGPTPPRIEISARRADGDWCVEVRDNGIGIARDGITRIFEIFQRLHTEEEYPGTGIGLALSKRIVERLGGRIWVESEAGRGSAFYFTVPAMP